MAKKLTTLEKYKILGICVSFMIMVVLQFHRNNGEWMPITPPNEWWSILTACIVYTFMSMSTFPQNIQQNIVFEHTKGLIWIALLLYLGTSYYLALPVNREVMAAAGAIQGFLYGSTQ